MSILVLSAAGAGGDTLRPGYKVMVDGNPEDVREINGMCRFHGDLKYDGDGIEVCFADGTDLFGTHRLTFVSKG